MTLDQKRPFAALVLCAVLLCCFLPSLAHAQAVSIDLGHAGEPGATGRLAQITALVTVLSLAPSLLVMVTAFTRIVVVLSLLCGALGAQGTPPNIVLIGLALFLTLFVMQSTLDAAWMQAIQPMQAGTIGQMDGLRFAAEPFRHFMANNLRAPDLALFEQIGHITPAADADHADWRALIPPS